MQRNHLDSNLDRLEFKDSTYGRGRRAVSHSNLDRLEFKVYDDETARNVYKIRI